MRALLQNAVLDLALLTLALVCLPSCGPLPERGADCVTSCGLRVVTPPEGWCDGLPDVEDKFLSAAVRIRKIDPRFGNACAAISGYNVHVKGTPRFDSGAGYTVTGWADCSAGHLYVGSVDVLHGALSHELVHAVQGCTPMTPTDPNNPPHSNWAPILAELEAEGLPQ